MLKFKRPRTHRELIPCFLDLVGKLEDFFRDLGKKLSGLEESDEKHDAFGVDIAAAASDIRELKGRLETVEGAVSDFADDIDTLYEAVRNLGGRI